jgi:phosphoglycerate kinase
MDRKTLADVDASGKLCFVRVDFNVPLDKGRITDDTRIQAALPTIRHLVKAGARIVLASHLGRPDGQRVEKYTLRPCAERLAELLGSPVGFVADCIDSEFADVTAAVAGLTAGQVILLENTRFYPGEESKKEDEMLAFAGKLALGGKYDLYVNDAFGASHRKHASMYGITKFVGACVAGFLVEAEATALGRVVNAPEDGFVAILGGAKVDDKIGVVEVLLPRVSKLLIGGAMAWGFLKARGWEIGKSLCTPESAAAAAKVLAGPPENLDKLVLPVDVHMRREVNGQAETKIACASEIGPDWDALDIGPQTRELYADIISKAKVVFWNGPMGYFEEPPFDEGTLAIARAMGDCPGYNVVGGGDSVAAVTQMGLADKMDHVSTGGGASLEFIENLGTLPAIDALDPR